MNKVFGMALLFMLFCIAPYVCADELTQNENETQVWTFEIDDDIEEPIIPEDITLEAPEEIFFDEITPDYKSRSKYKVDKTPNVKPIFYPKKNISEYGVDARSGDFAIISTSKKIKGSYSENALNQRTEAKYSKKYFEVSTGYETKYDNPDASQSSKSVFLAPKIKLGEEVSVIFNNRVDPTGTAFEQEVGLNFKPKLLPHSTFGVAGGTTVKNDSGERTRRMRFNTDLLLW